MERKIEVRRTDPLSLTAEEFPYELRVNDGHRTHMIGFTEAELDEIRRQAFDLTKG
jgi:hypothetical protein